MRRTTLVALALLLGTGVVMSAEDFFDGAVVQVIVTAQETDAFYPWQRRSPTVRVGYGVVLAEGRVLTTEGLVRSQTLVELQKAGSGEKITAEVVLADARAGLALLRVPASLSVGLRPVTVASALATTGEVEMVSFDNTARISQNRGRITQVSVEPLPSAPYQSLAYRISSTSGLQGEGIPVFQGTNLVGLAVDQDDSSRSAIMLPCQSIQSFLSDVSSSSYRGIASAGLIWTGLVDPVKRAYLKVPEGAGGVLILSCLPNTSASKVLKAGDVVLSWDGRSLDTLGFYQDPDYGRLAMPYQISGRRKPGDMVPVRISRAGVVMEVKVALERGVDVDQGVLVPDNITADVPEYLVEGGMVIMELTGRYLRAYGADWQSAASARLVNAYFTRRSEKVAPGDRVVILSSVIPDDINIGYHHIRDEIITHVNGKPVRNMADVFRIRDETGPVHRITILSHGVDLVLDQESLVAANARLAASYRIPALSYRRPVK